MEDYLAGGLHERGDSACLGDSAAEDDRMLLNMREFLKAQGADFINIVSAITYVKQLKNWSVIKDRLESAGFLGFPHSCVKAEVVAVIPS